MRRQRELQQLIAPPHTARGPRFYYPTEGGRRYLQGVSLRYAWEYDTKLGDSYEKGQSEIRVFSSR